MSKIDKLLKVLDMPENKQLVFVNNLWQNRQISQEYDLSPDIHGKLKMTFQNRVMLADLAFRLRDEVKDHKRARHLVYRHLIKLGKIPKLMCNCCYQPWWDWWVDSSQSIHWIIAALIAKELAKEQE